MANFSTYSLSSYHPSSKETYHYITYILEIKVRGCLMSVPKDDACRI